MESHAAVQGFRDWLQGKLLRAITRRSSQHVQAKTPSVSVDVL